MVEAQGKSLIEQKVELEAYLQAKEQEATNMKLEIGKLRERLRGEQLQNGEEKKDQVMVAWTELFLLHLKIILQLNTHAGGIQQNNSPINISEI